MNKRLWTIIFILALIAAPVIWWLASPLFLNNSVDEAFPFDLPSTAQIAAMPAAEKNALMEKVEVALVDPKALAEMDAETMKEVESRVQALSVDMPDKPMDDAMPEASNEWVLAAEGSFQDADSFHKGAGQARIFQQGEQRVLRFEDFTVTNGPDLHVLLVEKLDSDMGETVDLGKLKGNVGNQNYEIPSDLDLSKYSGVMIYCQPFHVVFATAAFGQ